MTSSETFIGADRLSDMDILATGPTAGGTDDLGWVLVAVGAIAVISAIEIVLYLYNQHQRKRK